MKLMIENCGGAFMSKRYNLKLFNENIRIVSEKDDAYVEGLYKYILSTIEKFDNVGSSFPMNYLTKALYACVFLADELLSSRKEVEELSEKVAELEKILEVKTKYKKIKENPFAYPSVPDEYLASKGYRFALVNNYMIFFIVKEKHIETIRFLYGYRDWMNILGKEKKEEK